MEKWSWFLDPKRMTMGTTTSTTTTTTTTTTTQTLVCVKNVKSSMPESEWDESMLLPGDIIEEVAGEDGSEMMAAKTKTELASHLAKLNRSVDVVCVKVRRGDKKLNLKACVVPEGCAKLQRRFTLRAASDDRHVVTFRDLTLDECTELQEVSKHMVNQVGFQKQEVKYDWEKKVGTYLPDQRCSVISSILFMPYASERSVEATTTRSMAWFSASVTSGIPLVFVNIQTEQMVISQKERTGSSSFNGREPNRGRSLNHDTTIQIMQGIRLWFLPGIEELPVTLTAEPGETRFGIDIKRTEEGFITVYSVTKGSAAERAGLVQLREQARYNGHLVAISRIQGKSLRPSTVSATGLINCCDHADVKEMLAESIDQMDAVQLHIMLWPSAGSAPTAPMAPSSLKPPEHPHRVIGYDQFTYGT